MPHGDVVVKCPYFEKENQVTIFCESTIGVGGYYAHMFKNGLEKAEYMREHCSKYPEMDCRYADYLEEHYGGTRNDNTRKAEKSRAEKQANKSKARGSRKKKSIPIKLM